MTIYDDLEVNILVDGDALEEFVGPRGSDYSDDLSVKYIDATVAVKVIVGQEFPWYDATKLLLTIVLGGVQILCEIDRPEDDDNPIEDSWNRTIGERGREEIFSFDTFRNCP